MYKLILISAPLALLLMYLTDTDVRKTSHNPTEAAAPYSYTYQPTLPTTSYSTTEPEQPWQVKIFTLTSSENMDLATETTINQWLGDGKQIISHDVIMFGNVVKIIYHYIPTLQTNQPDKKTDLQTSMDSTITRLSTVTF